MVGPTNVNDRSHLERYGLVRFGQPIKRKQRQRCIACGSCAFSWPGFPSNVFCLVNIDVDEQVEIVEEVVEGEVLINTFNTPYDNGDGLWNVSAPETVFQRSKRTTLARMQSAFPKHVPSSK